MTMSEVIKTRKSVRTFDGRPLTEEDKKKLCDYIAGITNPYGVPVEFVLLDAEECGLSSPVIRGEKLYIAAKVKKVAHFEEAYGISFEKMVLYAWSLGIGTTWIGGTMDRALFEKAAQVKDDEIMPIVSPLGYPAAEQSEVDIRLRAVVHGDERLSAEKIFFDQDFSRPLTVCDGKTAEALEAVRWYPSAANMQPCRIVKDEKKFHFYEHHMDGYTPGAPWDVQRIDIGIALCHFLSVTNGFVTIEDPGISASEGTEYIATVTV